MFAWMKSGYVLLVALLAVSCVQENKNRKDVSGEEDASGVQSDSALKIAIYYVGDAKCRTHMESEEGHTEQHIEKVLQANNAPKYMEEGKNTHRLDGNNAGLISKEYKGKKDNPIFGGDVFLKDNDIARTLATIENNCRRVLLSIDAEETPRIDSDNLVASNEEVNWPARFAADFGDFGGKITCGSSEAKELAPSLCNFAQINDGKRYFAYLSPKRGENSLSAEVTYTREGKELTETITVEGIARDEIQLPTTKLSDIEVEADCGEDHSCLFATGSVEYKLECSVQGDGCGNGFAYEVIKPMVCANDGSPTCTQNTQKNTATVKESRLCTEAATVADLSENEISLSCALSWSNSNSSPQRPTLPLRINASHLAGKLCFVTVIQSNGRKVGSVAINANACERMPEGKLKNYMLELSFSLD